MINHPPKAPIRKHINLYHGIEFNDNYHWIRNLDDPAVMEYIKQENNFTEEILSSFKDISDKLYSEMRSRTKEDDQSVPEKTDNYYYYERSIKDKEYEIYCRKKDSLDTPEEIFLDLNKRSEAYIDLGDFDISPNHEWLAYSLDFEGNETYEIIITNLATREEKIFKKNLLAGTVCFSNNNKGLFFDVLNDVSVPAKIFYAPELFHSNESIEIFSEEDKTKSVSFYRTKDKKFLFITSDDKDSTEVYFLDLNQTINKDSVKLFYKRMKNVIMRVYHNQDYFYILTNEDACYNFKIMRVKKENFSQQSDWEVFLPHNELMQLSYLEMFERYMALHIRRNGIKNIRIYEIETDSWHDIEFIPEENHTINYQDAPENNDFHSSILRFNASSFITPTTVYDYDMENRSFVIKKVDEISNYSKSDYRCKRLFAKADDGTDIPISVFYRNDLNIQADNPLLLYGYGCYGISTEPSFSPYVLSLVERGFIYALAHVRGGGEYGRKWYEQGKYEHKINSFTDFITCIKFLIDKNFTSPEKLALRGGSAGGLLLGAVTNMVPNLIKTTVMSVPFLDVTNTMMDPSIPLTTLEFFEFGNPISSKEIFDTIQVYSPYDNIKPVKYPNILVLTNINDTRVAYWEPVKYIAKLRANAQNNSSLIVLKTNLQAGHAGNSGRYEYIKELSLEYSFIYYTLVLKTENSE